MNRLIILSAAVLAVLPAAALADPHSRTVTVDGDRIDGTRTVTVEREAGTRSRDRELVRARDGATMTSEYDRQRTDTGVAATGSRTNFEGETRSFDYERTRTGRGYRAEGNVTGYNGESYDYNAAGRRTAHGSRRVQGLRDSDGDLIAGRATHSRRTADGQVVRRSVSRGPALHRRRGR